MSERPHPEFSEYVRDFQQRLSQLRDAFSAQSFRDTYVLGCVVYQLSIVDDGLYVALEKGSNEARNALDEQLEIETRTFRELGERYEKMELVGTLRKIQGMIRDLRPTEDIVQQRQVMRDELDRLKVSDRLIIGAELAYLAYRDTPTENRRGS